MVITSKNGALDLINFKYFIASENSSLLFYILFGFAHFSCLGIQNTKVYSEGPLYFTMEYHMGFCLFDQLHIELDMRIPLYPG